MNSTLDKRLKKAIGVIEGVGTLKTTSPKRNIDGIANAIKSIKEIFENDYWSKTYAISSINCLFTLLDLEDASLRLQTDQCLNAIFRKSILKSQPSRVLVALLNQLSKNGSARGFCYAITTLGVAIRKARENRLSVYAIHFLHALRDALKRPEQAVQLSIENASSDLISFFKDEYDETHIPYVNRLILQSLDNLTLGVTHNRAASTVLASLAINIPGMMDLICGRLLGLLSIAEEKKNKNEIVGTLNTFRKLWPAFNVELQEHTMRTIIVKALCCLRSSSSEIETAALELLYCAVIETPFDVLNFQPLLFKHELIETLETNSFGASNFLSRSNSISSLVESEISGYSNAESTAASEDTDEPDDISTRSDNSTPTNRENYVEMDPLFHNNQDEEDLSEQLETEVVIDEPENVKEIEGNLCSELPRSFCPPNSDFYFYSSTLIAQKFLLTGKIGELRSNAEVRTSIKLLALKYLAAIASNYEELVNIVVICPGDGYRQGISDLYQILLGDDESLCMSTYSLFANLENTYQRSGQKPPSNLYPSGKFLSLTNTLIQSANPRRLKEILQILANNMELVMSDDHLFSSVCDAALGSIECDYFLLKIARTELFAKIKWSRLNPQLISTYQMLCSSTFCRQCFDSDFRVVKAAMDNLPSLVTNAQFGFITDIFHTHWNESLYLPSFKPFSQVFALHPNYSFCGDSPNLAVEENLTLIMEILTKEYTMKPNERSNGFTNALLILAQSFPPSIFSSAWGFLNHSNQSHSILEILVEIADSSTTTLSQLIHTLKLIGMIFAGSAEADFIRNANRAESGQNVALSEGQKMLERILIIYLRVLNLYYTVINESTATSASPLFQRINWTSNSEQENSHLYGISNLSGSGIRPYKMKSSFFNSPSLCLIHPLIKGSLSNFMSSMKCDVEERLVSPLEAALDGLSSILEMLSSDILAIFIDELFLYVRSMTTLAISRVTTLLTQMLKVLFGQNVININPNSIVSLKVRHSVAPIDQLEMLIGRSINNYSVHVAFLDRFDQMDLHKIRHVGWANKTYLNSSKPNISNYLEQFEKSVTYLLNAYLNISNLEARCSILNLICVLVLNDVRYDKLDPNNRVLNSLLFNLRNERSKHVNSIDTIFTFLCILSRSAEIIKFNEVVDLLCKCVQRLDSKQKCLVDKLLNAVHIVLIEAICNYSTIPKELVKLLTFSHNSIFKYSPTKVIELWNAILHWGRSTKTDLLWQQLSTDFIDSVFEFMNQSHFYDYKTRWELMHSLTVTLKTCNPTVFRPVNQLFDVFKNVSKDNLFLCVPLTLTLLCRLDQETVILQLIDIDPNALESIGSLFANVFISENMKLFKTASPKELECLEDGIMFFSLMIVHILRSETLQSSNFSSRISDAFKSAILDSSHFEKLTASLVHISYSHPKVYASWALLIFQLQLFVEPNKTIFSQNLSLYSKQLLSQLFIQCLCDQRLPINSNLLQLLLSAPEDVLVRLFKVANLKQLKLIRERLPQKSREKLSKTVRSYFDFHSPTIEQKSIKTPDSFSDICTYLMQTTTSNNDIICLADLALNLDLDKFKFIIESIDAFWRGTFLRAIFESLNDQIRDINNNAYLIGQKPDFSTVFERIQVIVDLFENCDFFDSFDYRQILIGLHSLPEYFDTILLKSLDRMINIVFIKELMEAEIVNSEISTDFYDALTEMFKRGELDKRYSDDYYAIENLCLLLRLILDSLEKDIPKAQRFKINRTHWNVELSNKCPRSEALTDEILESFILTQRAAHLFLNHPISSLLKSAKKAVLSILRLPVFSRMFVIPKMALNRDWKLEIVGQADCIKIEVIQIYMLNDPEILSDCSRRILSLGWTSKTQFETWFMSLLGILCSAPIGDDLKDVDAHKLANQVNASSIAIDTLTNMIVQSLLHPRSGDTINSHYLIKHRQNRDSYLFLHSEQGKQSTIGRTQIEYSFEPNLIYVRNNECDEFSEKFYFLSQSSVVDIWSTFGGIGLENTALNRDVDISSSVKALLENFFHWFKSDINKLPLPILSATVKSLAVLSDLLDDPKLYLNVFGEMRKLLEQESNMNHPVYGYAIFGVLKTMAVVDLDRFSRNKTDLIRTLETHVQTGLSSTSVFVNQATLHGLLCLTQSSNPDDFNSICVLVSDFIMKELNSGNVKCVAYNRLLFAVAFSLTEQASDLEFMSKFISLIRSQFADPRLPSWQRKILSNGIQTLIIKNASYCESFRDITVELFDTYQLRPLHMPDVISVYLTWAYRMAQSEQPIGEKQRALFQSDLQRLLNLFTFFTVRKHIHTLLPPIAHLMFSVLEKEKLFEMLLSMLPIENKSQKPLSDYDRCMFSLYYYVLISAFSYKKRDIIEFSLQSVFPKMRVDKQSTTIKVYANILTMCALSADSQINSIVHIILRQKVSKLSLIRACYQQARMLFEKTVENCNLAINERDFPLEPVFEVEDGLI